MPTISKLNEDVLLELTRYLRNNDKLALAYSFRTAFCLSSSCTYWHPHAFTTTDMVYPTFLPPRVAPWSGYTGDEYRVALQRIYAFQRNWHSKRPRRNALQWLQTPPQRLNAILGSRWLISHEWMEEGHVQIWFVDAMTGLLVDGAVILRADHFRPVEYHCDPDAVVIGIQYPQSVNWNDLEPLSRDWKYDLIRVSFEEVNKDTGLQIKSSTSLLHSFHNLPRFPIWMGNRRHAAFITSEAESGEMGVYLIELSSDQRWVWRTKQVCATLEMSDDWLLILVRDNTLRVVAIYIPSVDSLLPHPSNSASYSSSLPEGTDILENTDIKGLWTLDDGDDGDYDVELSPAPMDPHTGQKHSIFEQEEDTFVILYSQLSRKWPIRFHVSYNGGLVGTVEPCLRAQYCKSSACRRPKREEDIGEPNNVIPSYSNADTEGWSTLDSGLQVAHVQQLDLGGKIHNRISGIDSPQEFHELEMVVPSRANKPALAPNPLGGDHEVICIDGDTGMVLHRHSSDQVHEYVVHWF